MFLYPLAITLILLSLAGRWFDNDRRVYASVTAFTLAAALLDFCRALPAGARRPSIWAACWKRRAAGCPCFPWGWAGSARLWWGWPWALPSANGNTDKKAPRIPFQGRGAFCRGAAAQGEKICGQTAPRMVAL